MLSKSKHDPSIEYKVSAPKSLLSKYKQTSNGGVLAGEGQIKSDTKGVWCQHDQQAVCACSPAIVNVSCCHCHQHAELHGDKQIMLGGNMVFRE